MSDKHKLQRDKRTGNYFVRFQVDGVRKRFTLGKNRDAARAALRKLEREKRNGDLFAEPKPYAPPSPVKGNELMLDELIRQNLEWVKENRAPGTYALYELYLHQFLKFIGNPPVSSITRLDLERFYAWAKKHHSKSANVGNSYLRHVKTALLWAEDMGLCECPVKKFPRMTEVPPKTIRFNDDEMKKFINGIPDEDFRDMIVFGFLTGLRPQELRALERHHVKQDEHGNFYLLIERHKTAKFVRQPKPRSVPLVEEAAEIVRRQMSKRPDCSHIFVNAKGRPYTGSVFRQRFMRWCERAGIDPRPPYALRHTFGSMQAEANVNQACLSHLMGHSQIRTTSRYVTPTDEYHRQAIASIKGRIMNCTNGADK